MMLLDALKIYKSFRPINKFNYKTTVDYDIYEFDLNHLVNCNDVVTEIYNLKKSNEKSLHLYDSNTNVRAWHSNWYTHLETNKFNKLIGYIIKACKSIYFPKNSGNSNFDLQLREFWTIIYKENEYTNLHRHSFNNDISISIVYFAYAEDNATPLKFHVNQNSEVTIDIIPKSGHLLCFPGFALHSVPCIKKNETRISASGNLSIIRTTDNFNQLMKKYEN